MASKRQTNANRRNAKKSTGPKTPEGKAASCMNSVKHGFRSSQVVIPGESEAEFDALLDSFLTTWQPQSGVEAALVRSPAAQRTGVPGNPRPHPR